MSTTIESIILEATHPAEFSSGVAGATLLNLTLNDFSTPLQHLKKDHSVFVASRGNDAYVIKTRPVFSTYQIPDSVRNEIIINRKLSGDDRFVKFHGYFFDEYNDELCLCLVFDFLAKARTLDQCVSLTLKTKESLFNDLIHIVKHLHSMNIVHRDIKPRNILVHNNKVYLIDFGLSTFGDKSSTRAGTLPFMAPELYTTSTKNFDRSVDIWACGITLWYLISGNIPFINNQKETIKQTLCNVAAASVEAESDDHLINFVNYDKILKSDSVAIKIKNMLKPNSSERKFA